MYLKPKRVAKLGDSLKNTMERKFLWKAIDAGRVGEVFKKISRETKELQGCQMVSWKDGVLKIKTGSSVQRQEIILKQERIKEKMRKRGIQAKEIKVVF